jgi:ElaB/YqjD/DUF883 family membrane-anchored ribosome-binding protein
MATKKHSSGNGNSHDLQSKLDALKADLEALQGHVRGLAGEVGGVAAERMNSVIADAMESVHEMTDKVEGWSTDNLESLRDSVRNQPLAALVLSMGAGALLGAILLRR